MNIFKIHWPAYLLALFFGALIVAPNFAVIKRLGQDFKGIYPVFNDDEIHYLAMTVDVAKGNNLGNPYVYEHRSDPYLQPHLTEQLFALKAKLLGLSVPEFFILGDFFFPLLGFLALYFLVFYLSRSRLGASAYASALYLIFLHSFSRPINQQFSFIFLAIGVLSMILAFENIKTKHGFNYAVLAAVVTGFLVYVYPYYWTALLVLAFLYLVISLFYKEKLFFTKASIGFLLVFIVLVLPYLNNLISAGKLGYYRESTVRIGLLNNHWPATYFNVGLCVLALVIFFAAYMLISSNNRKVLAMSLILSPIALNWQNMITGQYLQFSSHYYLVTILFSTLALYLVTVDIKNSEASIRKYGVFAGVIVVAVLLMYKQSDELKLGLYSNFRPSEHFKKSQDYAPVFDWLNKNSAKDSVVMAYGYMPNFIPIYTHNYIYTDVYAASYLVGNRELEERWIIRNLLAGDISEAYVRERYREIYLNKHIDRYQNALVRNKLIAKLTGRELIEPVMIDEEEVRATIKHIDEIKKQGLEKALKKYRADYVVIDSGDEEQEKIGEGIGRFGFIKPVVNVGEFGVYQIK